MGAGWRCACRSARLRSAGARDAPEPGAVRESRAAGIVEPEDAADELARRVEAADGLAVRVDHLRFSVDPQAAEAEGDAAGHRVGLEGWRVERVGPVGLVDFQPFGTAAILDVGIERRF